MVLARRDWPSPPISSAVYLTSFGLRRVSKIRKGNNNVWLSTYGEVMKERGGVQGGGGGVWMGWGVHRSGGELQLILEV